VVYLQEGMLVNLKKWKLNSDICDNMDKPSDPNVKWNMPGTEWQILFEIIYMWTLKEKRK
jgi:hypothetical protein